MLAFEDFDGQSAHVKRLREEFARGSFSHAYLLCGPRGTGKKSVARLCAMAALCRGAEKPCGVCGPCRRVLSGTHPDVHHVEAEKGRQTIGVRVLRDVIAQVSVRSFEDGAKAIFFPEAERMTVEAQNCLLKTLEEPPEGTVFFLITDQPGALLPTIVSRCRVIRFHPLSAEEAERRLIALGQTPQAARQKAHMAEGCVGRALEIDDERLAFMRSLTQDVFSAHRPGDVLTIVNQYKDDKERQRQILDLLEGAIRDILLEIAGGGQAMAGYGDEARAYARAVPLGAALSLADSVARARRMTAGNVAFAPAFESILLTISEEYAKWPW